MNRLLNFGEQNQDATNDTPLRGYHPRFRRTELLDITKSNIPRKWFLASTFQAVLAENHEERNTQIFSDSLNDPIRARPSVTRQTYLGDRFIPCRRGYSFEAAHCLLRKEPEDPDENMTIDVHKQLDLLQVTHQREAWRMMMAEQTIIPDLNQTKILHFSNSATQSQNPRRTRFKEQENWKCKPRKKTLIGSIDKILCMPSEGENIDLVDWNCNDMIGIASKNFLKIYNNDGTLLTTWKEKDRFQFVKWSNDGNKLAICTNFKIALYNLERTKLMWESSCKCLMGRTYNDCVIRCICWSSGDRHIVTGCLGSISVYASDTGKLISTNITNMARISTLIFSPNFKYLVSIAQDKTVGVFIWPDITPYYLIKFVENVKAIAWHPQMSNTLCIGDSQNGSLALWNINKKAMTANVYVKSPPRLHVENFAWNKLSGELVVHWTYKVGNKRYSIVPVLASFNRIVDALPLSNEAHISFLTFNTTHEELITYNNDVFSIWKFFGNEKYYERKVPLYNSTRRRQGVLIHNPIR